MQLFGSNYYLFCNFLLPICFHQYVFYLNIDHSVRIAKKPKWISRVFIWKKIVGRVDDDDQQIE